MIGVGGNVKISLNSSFFKGGMENKIREAVEQVTAFLANESTSSINKEVYMRPPSKSYVRTGRARRAVEFGMKNSLEGTVVRDTRIEGYRYDYARFLDAKTGFMKKAIKTTNQRKSEIIKKVLGL